ncbi:serine/threonine protein kinase [Streptomyces sp. CA-249302]|uniref:serine/threonine protein kinase n=1 Tax=Streptomyces sp. CA-249302 TaxID=3240058 RepID=UPI003D8EB100
MDSVDNGKYELRRKLGGGGMGVVWEAMDLVMERSVVVKLVRKDRRADKEMGERFLRECKLIGRLQHRNVVRAYSCGWDKVDGRSVMYLVMELLDGSSLGDLIRAKSRKKHRLSVEDTLRWSADICRGLTAAHKQGLVHRDLKPDNVQITADGTAVILDFGLACLQEDEQGTRITDRGQIVGTAAYMSPEQTEGPRVDQRSDLYSLGCLLYEMLTGEPPFSGWNVIMEHRTKPPLPPKRLRPDIPDALEELVLDLLEKLPDNRPRTAAEVRQRLRGIDVVQAHREPGLDSGPRAPERSPDPPPTSVEEWSPGPEKWYEVTGTSLITGLGAFGLLFGAGAVGAVASVVWGAVFTAVLFLVGAVANWMSADADTEAAWSCLGVLGWLASLVGCVWLMAVRGDFPWYYDFLIGLGLSAVVLVLEFSAVVVGDEWGWSRGSGTMALLGSGLLAGLGCVLFAGHLHFVWWTTVLTGLGLWAGTLALTSIASGIAYEVAHR